MSDVSTTTDDAAFNRGALSLHFAEGAADEVALSSASTARESR
jgi:hypothetical protein